MRSSKNTHGYTMTGILSTNGKQHTKLGYPIPRTKKLSIIFAMTTVYVISNGVPRHRLPNYKSLVLREQFSTEL